MFLRAAWLAGLAAIGLAAGAAPAAAADRNIGYSVAQEAPDCGPHICVHYVATTDDAPPPADADADGVPDFVELTLAEWEAAYEYEVTGLGWAVPPGDGTRGGGADLIDVYLKQRNGQAYASYDPDLSPDGGRTAPGYAVVDQDFAEFAPHFQRSLVRGVGAHELNHLLQFGTDTAQEHWFLEATATTTEEPFAPGLNSWVSYARRWGQTTGQPIDLFDHAKAYGSGALLMWLQARHGEDAIVDAWRGSVAAGSTAEGALDAMIRERGGEGFAASYAAFAAEVAEWRRPAMALPDRTLLTDAQRAATLAPDGNQMNVVLDHTAFALLDVPRPEAADAAELSVRVPDGVSGALALVGRTAEPDTGEATIRLVRLPSGGEGTVSLADPSRFARITAVLVNADTRVYAADGTPRPGDDAAFAARLSLQGVPAGTAPPREAAPPVVEAPPEIPTVLREPSLGPALRSVLVPRRVRRATAIRGLPLRLVADRPVRLTIEVRRGGRRVVRLVRAMAVAGRRTLRLRVPRRALPRGQRRVLTVVVRGRDAAGAVVTVRRRVVVAA